MVLQESMRLQQSDIALVNCFLLILGFSLCVTHNIVHSLSLTTWWEKNNSLLNLVVQNISDCEIKRLRISFWMIDTLKCHPLFRNCSIRAALPPQHQFTRQIFTKQILLTIYKIYFNSVDSYFRPDLFQVCIFNFCGLLDGQWIPRCCWQLWGF